MCQISGCKLLVDVCSEFRICIPLDICTTYFYCISFRSLELGCGMQDSDELYSVFGSECWKNVRFRIFAIFSFDIPGYRIFL